MVVLSEMPVPLHVGLTYVDDRVTDIIFVTVEQIDQVLSLSGPVDARDWIGRIVRWLQVRCIAFDRSGRLERGQRKVQAGVWLASMDDADVYSAWFGVNYNLVQTRRMLLSDDPVYLMAADLRMVLYGMAYLFWDYFNIPRLRWEGEKAAVRYLEADDPGFLEMFWEFVAETDRALKFELYERMAETTTAPAGGLWGDSVTAIQFEPGSSLGAGAIKRGLGLWDDLLKG